MIIPALDLIDGQVVRLFQGDYGQKQNIKLTLQSNLICITKPGRIGCT